MVEDQQFEGVMTKLSHGEKLTDDEVTFMRAYNEKHGDRKFLSRMPVFVIDPEIMPILRNRDRRSDLEEKLKRGEIDDRECVKETERLDREKKILYYKLFKKLMTEEAGKAIARDPEVKDAVFAKLETDLALLDRKIVEITATMLQA